MNNKEFSKLLETRTRKFAVQVIKLSTLLPNSPEGLVLRNQLTKSGTSIGANYREAKRRSAADFYNKIKISESEASETVYWLEIIEALNWIEENKFKNIYEESNELLAIFTPIKNKLKSK